MQRHNVFYQIHKGLRAALYHTALHLQQTDFGIAEETETAVAAVREVIMLFDEHAHKEDRFILSALTAFEPSVVDAFEQEHVTDLALSFQLNSTMNELELAEDPEAGTAIGGRLVQQFNEFIAFNLQHMAKEEDVLNKLLWRFFEDAEIAGIHQSILQATPPWMMDFYAKWMLRGINVPETTGWLQQVERHAPPVVFQTLMSKAEQELPGARFNRVLASLSEGAMLVS